MNYFGSCRKQGVAEQQIEDDFKTLYVPDHGFEGINIKKTRVNKWQHIVKRLEKPAFP